MTQPVPARYQLCLLVSAQALGHAADSLAANPPPKLKHWPGVAYAIAVLKASAAKMLDLAGPEPYLCVWCLEDTGWCQSTGGPHPCEGEADRARWLAEAERAPEVVVPGANPS